MQSTPPHPPIVMTHDPVHYLDCNLIYYLRSDPWSSCVLTYPWTTIGQMDQTTGGAKVVKIPEILQQLMGSF